MHFSSQIHLGSPLSASETQMASLGRFSYQRLRNEGGYDDDDYNKRRVIIRRAKSWSRFRRVSFRKRFKLKIPSLRRFMRRKAREVSLSWARILKRLKEGQSHFGDLFAGNYLFMQVTPTPMKCVEKSWKGPHLHGYPLQRIAWRLLLGFSLVLQLINASFI